MNFFAELDLKLLEEVKSLQGLHIKCLSVLNFCQKWGKILDIMGSFSSIFKIFRIRRGN